MNRKTRKLIRELALMAQSNHIQTAAPVTIRADILLDLLASEEKGSKLLASFTVKRVRRQRIGA